MSESFPSSIDNNYELQQQESGLIVAEDRRNNILAQEQVVVQAPAAAPENVAEQPNKTSSHYQENTVMVGDRQLIIVESAKGSKAATAEKTAEDTPDDAEKVPLVPTPAKKTSEKTEAPALKIVTAAEGPIAPKKKTTLDKRAAVSVAASKLNVDDQARRVRLGQLGKLPEQAKPKVRPPEFKLMTKEEFKDLSRDEQKAYKTREKAYVDKIMRARDHAAHRKDMVDLDKKIAQIDKFIAKGASAELQERREKKAAAEQALKKRSTSERAEDEQAAAEQKETRKRLKRTRRAAKWIVRGWVDTQNTNAEPAIDHAANNEAMRKLYAGEVDAPEIEANAEDPRVTAEQKARDERKAAQAARLGRVATGSPRTAAEGKFTADTKVATELDSSSN